MQTAETFDVRFRDELTVALPISRVHAAPPISDALLSFGLSLTGVRGLLPRDALQLLFELPIPLPSLVSGLAVLRAPYVLAYEEVWKPRCAAVVAIEGLWGITSGMKRLSPGAGQQAEIKVDLSTVLAVLHGQPNLVLLPGG